MAESTINQRIKILIKALNMSSRGFSAAIDSPDATTRNYIDGRAKPGADYLEKVIRRYAHVNLAWLLTGEGEMFISQAAEPSTIYQKNKGGSNQNIGTNNGVATTNGNVTNVEDCKKSLEVAEQTIAQLRSQLADKDLIIQLLQKQK